MTAVSACCIKCHMRKTYSLWHEAKEAQGLCERSRGSVFFVVQEPPVLLGRDCKRFKGQHLCHSGAQ